MQSPHRLLLALGLGALLVSTVAGQSTFTYNFNAGLSDFQSTFTRSGAQGANTFSYFATGGIADSGNVRAVGASIDSAVYNTALANTGPITLSTLFKTSASAGSFGDVIGLGLYLTPSTQTSGNASYVAVLDGTTSGLTANSWFKFTVNFTPSGSTFLVGATLQPFDASGTATGGAFSVSGSIGGYANHVADLAAADEIYAGLYGGTSGGNSLSARAIDNFSVTAAAIPEPSTYAAIFGTLALGGVIAHRRLRPTPRKISGVAL